MKSLDTARRFLEQRGLDLDPEQFYRLAVEVDLDFVELLRYIGLLAQGGQGVGPAPIAEEIAGGVVP